MRRWVSACAILVKPLIHHTTMDDIPLFVFACTLYRHSVWHSRVFCVAWVATWRILKSLLFDIWIAKYGWPHYVADWCSKEVLQLRASELRVRRHITHLFDFPSLVKLACTRCIPAIGRACRQQKVDLNSVPAWYRAWRGDMRSRQGWQVWC